MSTIIEVDFREAPPAQGGATTDHIPPGRYPLRVDRAEKATSTTQKPMLVFHFKVASGEYAGKRLRDNFVMPASADDSKFGLQRFHAFLLAFGLKVGERKLKMDIEALVGKIIAADVVDNTMEASGRYAARTTSTPEAYFPIGEMSKPATSNGVAADAVIASVTDPAAAVLAEARLEAAASEAAVPAATAVSSAAAIEAAVSELDDLFKAAE